jgi:DNA modification methylase
LCILESVSFTRKDGQYLRWDYRSGRKQGAKRFNKGEIRSFDGTMTEKLQEIYFDVSHQQGSFPSGVGQHGKVTLHRGSCLDILPKLSASSFDSIITSPPYCNRYDYTRTYALELAMLGIDEQGLRALRQKMLSCTVENRAKDLPSINPDWRKATGVADRHEILQTILAYLEAEKDAGRLNNNGIPRMVRGYFYEMACVISEWSRILKSGSCALVVNDNVRYAGASIPVDLILSDMAGALGFVIDRILVLPAGKGNSSQQMGTHGRHVLRKCVYVWRKP